MSHLSKTLVVHSFEDRRTLKQIAKENGVDVLRMMIYEFNPILTEEAKTIPGYEILPISVMNILMKSWPKSYCKYVYINATRQYFI